MKRVRSSLVVVAVLAAQPSFAAAAGPLRVGEIVAQPGQQASGWLVVPDGVDPGTRIPVSVFNGAKPGPVLALIAGTHGSEYTSIVALQRVRARLDPARLAGSVILVHMANPTTFYGRRIYFSPDGKNLNRVYPGQADGTISQRIAYAITTPGDRARDARRRHALRRRQRVAAPLFVLAGDRRPGASTPPASGWRSPSASTTS